VIETLKKVLPENLQDQAEKRIIAELNKGPERLK
jgi:hypothetical protein